MFSALAASVLPRRIGRNTIAAKKPLDLVVEANPGNARQMRAGFQK